MQLILTAFIVTLGLIPVLPYHQIGEDATVASINENRELPEHLSHFFNSIMENNENQIKTYHNILEQEAFREQQAFDKMKKQLQHTRQRNVYTQNDFHNNGGILLSKRQIESKFNKSGNVYNTGPEEGWEHAPIATPDEERLEDEYLRYWSKTDWRVQREWKIMRDWWFGQEHDKMKEYCYEFNELAGRKRLNMTVVLVQLNINFLRFRGKNSLSIARIDVCRYTENTTRIDERGEWLLAQSAPTYITSGLRSDCVYFLKPTDDTDMEFYLEAHICRNGTSGAGTTTANSEAPKCSTTGTDVKD